MGRCLLELEAVEVDQCQCQTGARDRLEPGGAEALGDPDGPGGQRRPLSGVATPGPHQRQGTEQVDPPHRVVAPGEAEPTAKKLRAPGEVTEDEVSPRLGVDGHHLDRVPSTEPEEVDDLVIIDEREALPNETRGLDAFLRWELAEHQQCVQRRCGDSLAKGEIAPSHEMAMGLRSCRRLVGGDLGGQQVDRHGCGAVSVPVDDGSQPPHEGRGLSPFEPLVTFSGDHRVGVIMVAGCEEVDDGIDEVALVEEPVGR